MLNLEFKLFRVGNEMEVVEIAFLNRISFPLWSMIIMQHWGDVNGIFQRHERNLWIQKIKFHTKNVLKLIRWWGLSRKSFITDTLKRFKAFLAIYHEILHKPNLFINSRKLFRSSTLGTLFSYILAYD